MDEVFVNFFIAILLGALVGIQREYEQQHGTAHYFGGLRTFILISLLGALLGYLSVDVFSGSSFILVGFIIVSLLVIVSYVLTFLKYRSVTATTEIAAILTFLIGLMAGRGLILFSVILGIVVTTFLTFKERLHLFAKNMNKKELFAIVKFALISLVVLPLLPRKDFSPMDVPILRDILSATSLDQGVLQSLNVFNLYNIWLMVILVAGISFLGYVLVKFLGTKRGYGLTGLVGGLVSSTAVTLSMASESKKYKKIVLPFVLAVVIASSTTFIRMILEVMVINPGILSKVVIPLGIMGITGYISAFLLWIKSGDKKTKKEIELKQPFALGPAIKFGLFFAFIIFASKLMQLLFGKVGIYITSVLSGLADVDAITLTMSSLSASGDITSKVAVSAIILAASSNTLVKAGMSWFLGEKKFAKYILVIFGLILAFGLTSLIII